MPKRRTAPTPSACTSSASAQSRSTDRWAMPSRPSRGCSTPVPGQAKSGKTRSRTSTRASRTRSRRAAVRRKRRKRVTGKTELTRRSPSARSRGGTMFPREPLLLRLLRAARAKTLGKPHGFPTPFPPRDRKLSRKQSSHGETGRRAERQSESQEPRGLPRERAPRVRVVQRGLEEVHGVAERECPGSPPGSPGGGLGNEPDEHERKSGQEGHEHGCVRLA